VSRRIDCKAPTVFKSRLRAQLAGKFPDADIKRFLDCVGAAIGQRELLDSSFPTERGRREQLASHRRATKRFAAAIEQPAFPVELPLSMEEMGRIPTLDESKAHDEIARRFYGPWQHLKNAAEAYVEAIDNALKAAEPRSRGRRVADAGGLVLRVAQLYQRCLGPPKSTKGGAFANVAAIVLEAYSGRMPEDVSRHVRSALRQLTK
jgi:hypothetical protein